MELVGCNLATSEEIISCMQTVSTDLIIQAQKSAGDDFWPVINENDLYYQPIDYLYNGNYNKVYKILFTLQYDWSIFTKKTSRFHY